jgi:hypothetical protein
MMADPALLAERAPAVTAPVLVEGQTHEVRTDALAPVLLEYFAWSRAGRAR